MTVEEIRGDNENCFDNFPVGLRVLAVDDDPICLKLLETLLRKCQYHVTATSQAVMALKMLRENRDRFDLVISDVHMPDMDGFKLLELVGLEMDLPVIMLSANSDPKLVMKGVTHGACDYLVKPIRIEELRNIWQHVIRRKKFDSKNQQKSTDQSRVHQGSGDGYVSPVSGNTDQNGKFNRKRKDEEDESEDNGNDSEDPATQKKPRVVWSIELHRKFVAAVNQLGIEKAVPKRILDLMNVDGLTRENVASHLQKYRLYLKRISSAASQQANIANIVAALGVKDSPYMLNGSLDGIGDFRTLTCQGRLAGTPLSPYTAGGMLGRLNSPANVNLHNLTPSSLLQLNHGQSFGKIVSPSSQNSGMFQGIPPSLDLDQLQQGKSTTGIGSFNTRDDSSLFGSANTFAYPTTAIGSSSNLLNNSSNNSMIASQTFGNHPPNNIASFNSESFNAGPSNLLETSAMESSKIQANSLVSTDPFHSQLPVNRKNNLSAAPYLQNNSVCLSSASMPLANSRGMQCAEMYLNDVQNLNQGHGQRWEEQRLHNFGYGSNHAFATLNSHGPSNTALSPLGQDLDQNNGVFNQKMDVIMNGRSGVGTSSHLLPNENEKSGAGSRSRFNETFLLEQSKMHDGFPSQGYDTLDELMSVMIKREEEASIPNCDFGLEEYSFGTGM